jgi:hypothetical protein
MKLPPQIELRAKCSEAADLSDIIFEMQVTAGSKNPYRILFPKTARDGRTQLSAADVRGQFTDHSEMALMDYNGSLDDAVEVVTLRLFDPASVREHYDQLLAWPLFTHEKTRWQSRRQFLDDLLSCRNDQFTFGGISVRLAGTEPIYLPLDRAVVDTNAI